MNFYKLLFFILFSHGLCHSLFVRAEVQFDHQDLLRHLSRSLELGEVLSHCKIEIVKQSIPSGHWALVETDKSPEALAHKSCNYVIRQDEKIQTMEGKLSIIHELAHIIRHQYNPHEVVWLDEGIAQLIEAEYIQLFPMDKNERLNHAQEIHLSIQRDDYKPGHPSYSISYFFLKYLYSRFGGIHFVREALKSPYSGWENIEHSLKLLKQKNIISIADQFLNRQSLWTHFVFALTLNTSHHADYGLFLIDFKFTKYPAQKMVNLSSDAVSSIFVKSTDAKAIVFKLETKEQFTQILENAKVTDFENVIMYAVQNQNGFKAIKINSVQEVLNLSSVEMYTFILMSRF